MRNPLVLVPAVLFLGLTPPCIWDSDTLGDELRGLPGAYELIVGRWFRHSQAYYKQRIDRLPAHISKNPSDFAAYDDLAVAFERLRNRKKAIEIIQRKKKALDAWVAGDDAKAKDKAYTEHLYRYHANLGTFYAHSGRFDDALIELRKAIKINPDAHFGREKFQIDLIRYVAAARKDKTLWTRHDFFTFANYSIRGRSWFTITGAMSFKSRIRHDRTIKDEDRTPWQEAYTGVAGMLRFGGLEGAELYRSIGDLFLIKRDLNLAWWAYKMAVERGHPAAEQIEKACAGIEKHWKEAAKIGRRVRGVPTMEIYRKARADADRWMAAFTTAEKKALAEGKDTGKTEVLSELIAAADKAVPLRIPAPRGGRGGRGRSRAPANRTNEEGRGKRQRRPKTKAKTPPKNKG